MSISSVSIKARVLACFIAGAFFLLPDFAYAKSDDSKLASYEKKLADTATYGDCKEAKELMTDYKKKDCTKVDSDYHNASEALNKYCNKFKQIKPEYEKCTKGGMENSKNLYKTLQVTLKDAAKCSSEKSSILSEIDSALSTCKKDKAAKEKEEKEAQKAAEKKQKETEKAREKADKSYGKMVDDLDKLDVEGTAEALEASKNAKEAYDNAVKACDEDEKSPACSQLKSLYKAYEKAAKKAGKTVEKYEKTANKIKKSAEKAKADEQKALDLEHNCLERQYYDVEKQKCVCHEGYTLVKGAKTSACILSDRVKKADSSDDDTAEGVTNLKEVVVTAPETSMDEIIEKEANEARGYTDTRCKTIDKSGEDHGTFGIFNYLACKITTVVADIRAIVYVLAGFGMIAFAYGAIIGKINFKQLANIFIGLFILSMTTGFIEAVVFNDGTSHLTYGDFLPNGNHGQYSSVTADCSSDASLCPDAALAGMEEDAKNSSWSFKDLKSSISSVKGAIKTVSDTYHNVKNTVDTAINAVNNIGNVIKNGGSFTDVVSNIAANVDNVMGSTNLLANQVSHGVSSLTSDLRDMKSSSEQIAYRQELEKQYNLLKGKCDTGNCSENEKASLAKMAVKVEENKTATDKWLENNGKGGGATILAGLGKVAAISSQANQVTSNVAKAYNQGKGMAGGALGTVLGAVSATGEAYTSGSNALDNMQKKDQNGNSTLDFRSGQKRAADNAAEAAANAKKACLGRNDGPWTWDGKQCTKKDKNGNTVVADLATGIKTMTKTNEDGTISTYTQKKNADGSLTTTGVTKDKNGNTVSSKKSKTTYGNGSSSYTSGSSNVTRDANGNTYVNGRNAEADKCTNKGGHWNPETKVCELPKSSQAEENCKKKGGTLDPKTAECIINKE